MNKESEILEYALAYSENLPVFPLAPLSTIPLKGSHGYKDGTNDKQRIAEWFNKIVPDGNLAFSLAQSNVFVIDIDMKKGKNGLNSLNMLRGTNKISDTPIVKTPNGGYHVYYRTSEKIHQQQECFPGVDILTLQVAAPPSIKKTTNGGKGKYQLMKGSFCKINEAPEWLLNQIKEKQSQKRKNSADYFQDENQRQQTYVSKMFEEIVDGARDGDRNVWLTRQFGRLIALGVRGEYAYEILCLINENYVWPPLEKNEVNTIMKSVIRMELTKNKGEKQDD